MLDVSRRRAIVAVQIFVLSVQIAVMSDIGRSALTTYVIVIRIAILVISNVTIVIVDGLLRRIEIRLVVRVTVLGRIRMVMMIGIVVLRFVQEVSFLV